MNTTEEQDAQTKFINNPPPKWLIILIIVLIIIILVVLIWLLWLDKKQETMNYVEQENKQTIVQEEIKRPGVLELVIDNKKLKVGDEVEVQILVDTKKSNIVVASVLINYDINLLQLTDMEVEDSVLTMGVLAKKGAGTVEIIRGIPGNANPDDKNNGYTGQDGLLGVLKFKVLKAGETNINFEPEKSNLVLDNGLGSIMQMEYKNLSLNIKP